MKVRITKTRLAFAQLFDAKAVDGEGDPRYSAAFILDPNSPDIAAIEAAEKAVAKEKFGEKWEGVLKKLKDEKRTAFSRKPRTNAAGEVYAGFDGMFSLNASNKARPTVVDRDKTHLAKSDGKPYSGCYVEALVEFWAQDNQYGRRINCTLRGVRFLEHGDSFGGGAPASADEFEDLEPAGDDMA